MTAERGNAVPETALTVSFTLLVLFSIVQLATTAFYQISADGASFVAAHDTVATYGSPTTANVSNAASSASSAFAKIVSSSVSVLNPSGNTFETDIAQKVPGISALGNPALLTIDSRLIEASGGTASPSPVTNCVQGGLNIVNSANNSVISSKAVGLLEGSSLISAVNLGSGTTTTLNLNTAPITSRVATLSTVLSDLKTTVSTLTTLSSTAGAVPLLGGALQSALSKDLQTPVTDALNGTFTATSELTAIDSQLTSQVPGIGSILVSVVNPLLTGGTAATGLLGSNGPLSALNSDMKGLQTIDAAATSC